MNPAYRAWWRALMDLRPLVRFLAERFPRLAPWGVRLRSVLHGMVGNLLQSVLGVEVLVLWLVAGWPGRWLLGVFVAVCVVLEVVSMRKKFIFVTGGVLSSLGKGLSYGPLHQRRPRHDERRTSTARCSSPTTAPRPISIWATTSASPPA